MVGLLLLVWLVPASALAGSAGNVHLSRPVNKVAVGTVPIYLQALQHDVYPLGDAEVKITGYLDGAMAAEVIAALDPTYGGDNVYLAQFPFDRPGNWRLVVETRSRIFFLVKEFQVEVLPAGTPVAPLGKIRIMERGASNSTNHAYTQLVEREAAEPRYAPAPGAAVKAAMPWVGGGMVSVAGVIGALLLLNRRRR
jgi:hypothetical protein